MYIERKQALETINRLYETRVKRGCYSSGEALSECVQEVMAIPAADVVEVVRCRDCKLWDDWHDEFDRGTCNNPHFNFHHSRVSDRCWHPLTRSSWFCSYGERKEQK